MNPYEIALKKRGWVVTDGGCWEYLGTRHNRKGYREVYVRGRTILAHRAAYMAWVDEGLEDLHVLHSCDNPPCINPQHLSAGTNSDNVADKIAKGRAVNVRGAQHPMAILKPEQALEIYNSDLPLRVLSDRFGVSKSTVSAIRHKRLWAHLHEGG